MRTLLVSLVVAVSSVAAEAQAPGHPHQQPPIPPPGVQIPPGGFSSRTENAEASLDQNITLKINGKSPDGTPIDFAMTGTGPIFHMSRPGENHAMMNHEHHVRATDSGYEVKYSIGLRIRIGDEFRDVAVRSTVSCTAGDPVVIAKSGGNELTLVIEEAGRPSEDVVEESADVVEEVDVKPADAAQE